MVRQLHDGMMARVTNKRAASGAFAVINGVKQGCVLAPTLFSPMFAVMLMDVRRDEHPGIRVAYRTDGRLLNQRRMHFQSRKTVVMRQPPPDVTSQINVNGAAPHVLDNLTYLDSIPFLSTEIDDEVAHQISKASQAFRCLQNTV
nr:unnamed protein product [Spirometra erinaceieuropaei]